MDYSVGSYSSYIAYVDDGKLVNAELTSNTEVELGVTSIIGSYIEITEYESELDREMRICVEFQ